MLTDPATGDGVPAPLPAGANPVLGICIPTYKRPEQLALCVRSIVRSGGARAIPIFIADDAADDTNAATIAALRAEYPHLVYRRNAANLGIDRNIVRCISMCPCEYAWPMGEDDRLTPEAVDAVLDRIAGASPRPDFVYVNYAAVNGDVSRVVKERSLPLDADAEIPIDRFVAEDAWSIGFIGACVVATERWRAVDPTPYVGTFFAHAGAILESLVGRRVHAIARPLVLNRGAAPGDFTWAAQTFEVLDGWQRMTRRLAGHYPDALLDACVASFAAATRCNTLRFLCYARAGNVYDREKYAAFVRPRAPNAAYRAAAWAVAATPHALFRGAKSVWDAMRRNRWRAVAGA